MFIPAGNSPIKNTDYNVVIPFYAYAALSFLIATIFILGNPTTFARHYFDPVTLAITHTLALGWGTMIILGASHQLFPVLIEGKLRSNLLAHLSFVFAGLGIPLLVYGFYKFNMGSGSQWGGVLINLAVLCYLANLGSSMAQSKKRNVHAIFAITSGIWLLSTTGLGLLLVVNFNQEILPKSSLQYLSLHAHLGIVGWFLLMVIGVGSRLIPMFLISKHTDPKRLWWIFGLINAGLLTFLFAFFSAAAPLYYFFAAGLVLCGLGLFGQYVYVSYTQRIRKKVDGQMKLSILSVVLTVLPILVLMVVMAFFDRGNQRLVLLYGSTIFLGWITAIILGMTFKTLPFIVWNKVYRKIAGLGKTPNPKALFSHPIFVANGITYLLGFVIFGIGIVLANVMVLRVGAIFLLLTALLYNFNVFKILFHKAKENEHINK